MRDKLRKIGINVNGECPFCQKDNDDINHLFNHCEVTKHIWNTISIGCPSPHFSDMSFVDWLEHIWNNKTWYDKVFHNPIRNFLS